MDILQKFKTRHKQEDPAREKILQRFETWLDEVLEPEAPLEGIDEQLLKELEDTGELSSRTSDEDDDLYSTWSAMTALTQEVRLQGRAFKDLTLKIDPLGNLVDAVEGISATTREAVIDSRQLAEQARDLFTRHEAQVRQDARARSRAEFLDVFLDVRDRLNIGLESVIETRQKMEEKPEVHWFGKWRGGGKSRQKEFLEMATSLKKGYELGLERLDETLLQHDLSEISCRGELFDPQTMTAVDAEERDDIPDGTVIDVYRTGYVMGGEVYRPAQVKVSRMPKDAE